MAADPKRAWELAVNVENSEVAKRLIIGAEADPAWQTVDIDLSAHSEHEVTLRLYQNLSVQNLSQPPSMAHWKKPVIRQQP